jgi:hypothetical protein
VRRLRFAALGAALAYFFDPDNGSRRRALAGKKLAALAQRHGSGEGELADELVDQARSAQGASASAEPASTGE